MTEEKKGARGLVPKLRFPEFRDAGEWEFKPLNKLAKRKSNKNVGQAVTRVLTNSAEHGVVDQRDYFEKDIATQGNLVSYSVVAHGDYVYNPRISNLAPVGPIGKNKVGVGVMSPLYTVFRFTVGDDSFYEHYFRSTYWHSYLRHASNSGARHDRMAISNDDFMLMPLPAPKPAEQQKIAECLSSLDKLIAAETEKLTALQDHKNGLMHQLFPAEGETTPRLRFPEFKDAGEWAISSLETLVSLQSGSTPDKSNPLFWNGSIPWASAKDMKQLFLDDTQDHISLAAVNVGARLVPADSLLILTRGMTLLKDIPICVLRREMACNQDVKALVPRTGVNGLFLAFALLASKRRLLEMVVIAGHGTGKLNTDELEAIELALPPAAEQQRIIDLMSWLDKLLEAQSTRVKQLKNHKNGLMEQLFPSVAGALA